VASSTRNASGDNLLAWLIETGYAAGHQGGRRDRCRGVHNEIGVRANGPAAGHVRQLDAGTPDSMDGADGSREIAPGSAARPARDDRGQRGVLLAAGPIIEVQADPPR